LRTFKIIKVWIFIYLGIFGLSSVYRFFKLILITFVCLLSLYWNTWLLLRRCNRLFKFIEIVKFIILLDSRLLIGDIFFSCLVSIFFCTVWRIRYYWFREIVKIIMLLCICGMILFRLICLCFRIFRCRHYRLREIVKVVMLLCICGMIIFRLISIAFCTVWRICYRLREIVKIIMLLFIDEVMILFCFIGICFRNFRFMHYWLGQFFKIVILLCKRLIIILLLYLIFIF
jgi:hypothetical protein